MPIYPPNFRGAVANGATQYIGIPVGSSGRVSIHFAWLDATTAGTVVFQTTQYDSDSAPVETAGAGNVWETETAVTITVSAGAAGSSTAHVSNLGPHVRARLAFTASANSVIEVRSTTE